MLQKIIIESGIKNTNKNINKLYKATLIDLSCHFNEQDVRAPSNE